MHTAVSVSVRRTRSAVCARRGTGEEWGGAARVRGLARREGVVRVVHTTGRKAAQTFKADGRPIDQLVLLRADPEVSPSGGPATYLRIAHARNFFQNYCVKEVVTRAG